MGFAPVIIPLLQDTFCQQSIPRFLTLVFEDQVILERKVQEAFRKVFRAEKVFLHEKSRNNYRVEYQVKYVVSGKEKTDKTFKIYNYGKYGIIVADLGLPTENPDKYLIAYILMKASTTGK